MKWKRLPNPQDSEQAMAIARLRNHQDFKCLGDFLDHANEHIDKILRSRKDDAENHRDQGAGQVIDDLLELFDKAEEMAVKMVEEEARRRVP